MTFETPCIGRRVLPLLILQRLISMSLEREVDLLQATSADQNLTLEDKQDRKHDSFKCQDEHPDSDLLLSEETGE